MLSSVVYFCTIVFVVVIGWYPGSAFFFQGKRGGRLSSIPLCPLAPDTEVWIDDVLKTAQPNIRVAVDIIKTVAKKKLELAEERVKVAESKAQLLTLELCNKNKLRDQYTFVV